MNFVVLVSLMPVFLCPCTSLPSSVPNDFVHISMSEVLTSYLHSRHVREVGSNAALAVSNFSDCCGTSFAVSEMGSTRWSCCHLLRVLAGCLSIAGR